MKRALVWAILVSGLASRAVAQDDPLEAVKRTLAEHRFEMTVDAGGISGPGADLLLCEAAAAQFVLIGEFHGTKEVPLFTAHLPERLRPAGFDVFCAEIGPISAEHVLRLLDSGDGMSALEAFCLEHSGARLQSVISDDGELTGGAKGFRQQDVLELVSLLETPPLPYRAELVEEIIE
ncbi:MAG: hypothetical protein AB1486_33990 [Planctomycetota bacterium]